MNDGVERTVGLLPKRNVASLGKVAVIHAHHLMHADSLSNRTWIMGAVSCWSVMRCHLEMVYQCSVDRHWNSCLSVAVCHRVVPTRLHTPLELNHAPCSPPDHLVVHSSSVLLLIVHRHSHAPVRGCGCGGRQLMRMERWRMHDCCSS